MNRVYLKCLTSFLLIFFVLLVVLLRQEPSIIMKQVGIDLELPSDSWIVFYAFLYALFGTAILYYMESTKASKSLGYSS
jgi:hypothetical protein